MKAVLALMLLLSSTTSAVARDGEVFFRNKGRVQVGPGAQIEVVDCEPSADNQGNATGGLTTSGKATWAQAAGPTRSSSAARQFGRSSALAGG